VTYRNRGRATVRLLLAGGVSALLLTPLVAFGGIGFAKGSPSAGQYQYAGGKTTICHRTHSKKHPGVTITVSNSALPAHMRHGDTLGPCAASTATAATTHGAGKSGNHGNGRGHGKP